jgi:hypothetical protein
MLMFLIGLAVGVVVTIGVTVIAEHDMAERLHDYGRGDE